ncbi:hypothetical protein MAR_022860 [Mya arenaria]|uniref:Mitochondria-eating protein C-terminal domain-containing protein n=1 Tax=Mya arenaria TaxID=6604 RepID=A0ABY7DL98_MYAAR|nr:hypothetical protein MAR_022860 [Mya arenaria]
MADDHCDELYKQHIDAVRNGLTTLSINYKTKKKPETDMQRGEDDKNETTRQTIKPDTNTDATREERDVLEIDYEENTEEIPFEFDDLNNTQKQAIADIGRFVQNALEKKVVEVTSKVIVEEIELPEVAEILAYVRKCVTFCWSARRHDPPVYIDFMEVTDDTLLDLNVYKPYTKKGKLVDYVVWPPIYLHKGGPMLSKGVAQGKNKN